MKYLRFAHKERALFGVCEGEYVKVLKGEMFGDVSETGEMLKAEDVKLLPPCRPSKIVALALNYRDHAEEINIPIPDKPVIFIKPSTSVIGPEDAIIKPDMCQRLDYEAELGIVIGRRAAGIEPEDVGGYIFGVTCVNDVTARDLQPKDGQWTLSKSFDTFSPIGPCIAVGLDYDDLDIELRLNGETRQKSNTSNFIFKTREIVSYLSRVMTLLPGDVIITGTPSGIGPMEPGDVVEVDIEGIGVLKNHVR